MMIDRLGQHGALLFSIMAGFRIRIPVAGRHPVERIPYPKREGLLVNFLFLGTVARMARP